MTGSSTTAETIAAARKPLYSAAMMLLLGPSLTMKVPITEPSRQMPPTISGYSISAVCTSPVKKIAPSSMVATTVTA